MSEPNIHPTARVASSVTLGPGVVIGAFAVIEDDVSVGANCVIEAHAVIRRCVSMGVSNRIHPHAVLGGLPQDLGFNPETVSYLVIGDNNVFREGFTANRATQKEAATRIGNDCYFMNNSHVAHDCVVGDACIFATSATIGGHVQVGDKVFFGGGSMAHQFCRIGSLTMIRGVTGITKDVLPFSMIAGYPPRHFRLNTVGVRRAGIEGERLQRLSTAFRCLMNRENIDGLVATPEIDYLHTWLSAESKRGIHGFVARKNNKD